MKIAIIVFSPSGNTNRVSELLDQKLTENGHACQRIDFTGNPQCFTFGRWENEIKNLVNAHDIIMIGGPVYEHHLHYNVMTLINHLPAPDSHWGAYAVPFATYGGMSPGIALKEAGEALKKKGRIVLSGMKVSMSHKMTRAFLDQEFNAGISEKPMIQAINDLVERISCISMNHDNNQVIRSFSYNGFKTLLKANIIFKEKKWHAERYPKVSIDSKKCNGCGLCSKHCPVLHLKLNKHGIMETTENACIHCLNCVVTCPQKAINLIGDLEKGRKFMSKMIAKNGNKEQPATCVYPIY